MQIRSRTRFDSIFGKMVSTLLAKRGWTQEKLAKKCEASVSQINQVIIGRRSPLPMWVDRITEAMKLSEREAMALNWAAARVMGYRLGEFSAVRFLRGGGIEMPALAETPDPEDDEETDEDFIFKESFVYPPLKQGEKESLEEEELTF